MLPQWIIENKRDGKPLSEEEIRFFISGYADGIVPDYQASAFAMAVYFQGMSFEEVTLLTDAMMKSGDMVDMSSISMPTADKHSTGGVGDKVSLVLAPLAACCGIGVPMLSGRGLGITGGTLDKLESIPGYRTDLSVKKFLDVISVCGCSIMGQTAELAPADKKLYALRDVTGTVPSIPLISASIMSKKLAEGAGALVLDVKHGSGAFMKTEDNARELARTMVEIGKRMGRGMTAVLTDMNQPLGRAAGNAVEVVESVNTLKGNGPEDLVAVTIELTAHMMLLTGKARTRDEAVVILKEHLESGRAYKRFVDMVRLHGGAVEAVEDMSLLPTARTFREYPAPKPGYVARVDAECVGRACIVLGAGRKEVTDSVDHAVGITELVKIGEKVESGDPLLKMHINAESNVEQAEELLDRAFEITEAQPEVPRLIGEIIT